MTSVESSIDRILAEPDASGAPTLGTATPHRPIVARDPFTAVRTALVCAYVAAYAIWFATRGVIVDRISVTVSVGVLLVVANVGRPVRRWIQLARDMALYAAMWFAYEESRGIADRLGFPLQVESVRNIDRALLFGADASVVLQRRFYDPDHVRWYDVAGSFVYLTHFWLPVAVIAVLFVRNRRQWARFMRRFATVLFAACIMFVVVPTAPPWMAAGGDSRIRLDALGPVERIPWRAWRHVGLESFVHAWDTGRDWLNYVAAMPSLHAAFALFVVVFAFPWVRPRVARLAMLGFPVAMAAALVYLGEHYVADVLAGWLLVGVAFWVWNRIERWQRRRRIVRSRLALASAPDVSRPVP